LEQLKNVLQLATAIYWFSPPGLTATDLLEYVDKRTLDIFILLEILKILFVDSKTSEFSCGL
jgi:hypothetical protein